VNESHIGVKYKLNSLTTILVEPSTLKQITIEILKATFETYVTGIISDSYQDGFNES
jgi:hypothetical protein